MDLVIVDGKARGIIARNLVTGEIERHSAHAVVIASGGYGNVYFLSTNAMGSNVSAAWKIHKKGAYFANPCFVQIHPTCIPVHGTQQSKLTLMSESLRNSGRIWVPKKIEDAVAIREGKLRAENIKEEDRDYYLERRYPAFGNLVPRDVASRAGKERCDAGFGIENNDTKEGVFLDFSTEIMKKGKEAAIEKHIHNPTDQQIYELGKKWIEEKYGNLFQMYEKITADDPYKTPMKIYPAVHYTMGGVWVDYNLQSTIPGCFVIGEANFSDHGANRLGASALMQGLADGYFVLPYTIADYLSADIRTGKIPTETPEFTNAEKDIKDKINFFLTIPGCFVIGEANFSDHGANRLGASALMQGLADGYFVLPYTIADYLSADIRTGKIPTETPEFTNAEKDIKDKINFFLTNKGTHSVDHFHKQLGNIMWNKVGMGRTPEGLREAIREIEEVRKDFWQNVKVPGDADNLNPELEKAFRVADFLELGQLMAIDALNRNESCGGHFREDHATPDGEAERDDVNYKYVAAWEYKGGDINQEVMHKEELVYENIEVKARSYK